MRNAFSPILSQAVETQLLEDLLVCEPEAVAEAEARMVAESACHALFRGAAGAGKSHCAEVLVRRLAERHQWRVVRLSPVSHFLQGLDELVAAIADRDRGIERAWADPTPSAELSIEALRVRERETERPLVVLLEDLPAVLERTLRGADVRRFVNIVKQLRLGMVATARTTRLGRAARPLLSLFTEIHIRDLEPERADELILHCARSVAASDSGTGRGFSTSDSSAVWCTRTLLPLVGGNPRLITSVYRLASRRAANVREPGELKPLLDTLMARMAPYFRAQLDALSPQQGLVLTRLALAPGPVPAARLGRQCELPTSHTTAILDVLLQRQLVIRAPGPGKRNVYSLTDRLLRLHICTQARPGATRRIGTLLHFFALAQSARDRTRAFADLRAPYGQTLRALMAPHLGDIRSAIQTLASVLRPGDEDPGNRVLAAFLSQPRGAHDERQLRATIGATADGRSSVSGPERAVAHLALAAHLLQSEAYPEAADELTRALALAPNWRDLAATALLVQLAAGDTDVAYTAPDGRLAASLRAAAAFFANAPGSDESLRAALVSGGADQAPVWRAIAAVLPGAEEMRPRAMAYYRIVGASLGPSAELSGMACVYAFELGLWSEAAHHAAAYDTCAAAPSSSLPARSWLAAMSGDLPGYVTLSLRSATEQVAPAWRWAGLAMAARTSSAPDFVAGQMARYARSCARGQPGDQLADMFASLLLIRDYVSIDWLARLSGALADETGHAPQPFSALRAFVAGRADERMLRTMHPEIRAALAHLRHGPQVGDATLPADDSSGGATRASNHGPHAR